MSVRRSSYYVLSDLRNCLLGKLIIGIEVRSHSWTSSIIHSSVQVRTSLIDSQVRTYIITLNLRTCHKDQYFVLLTSSQSFLDLNSISTTYFILFTVPTTPHQGTIFVSGLRVCLRSKISPIIKTYHYSAIQQIPSDRRQRNKKQDRIIRGTFLRCMHESWFVSAVSEIYIFTFTIQ
jgi:hypothetical protein